MPWTTFFPFFAGVFLLLSHADAMAPFGADGLNGVCSSLLLRAKCKFKNGELACPSNKHKDDEDDADNDDKSKKKKKTGNICEGDNHCGAGFTDLETANKYGACCEPAKGFQTAPKEAEKCKFPGEVGTPPNCTCPPGTEFYGYKGCVEPYCCTSYGDASDGGGSIKACGEHAEAQEKVTSHLFNGHPPARFECYPK